MFGLHWTLDVERSMLDVHFLNQPKGLVGRALGRADEITVKLDIILA